MKRFICVAAICLISYTGFSQKLARLINLKLKTTASVLDSLRKLGMSRADVYLPDEVTPKEQHREIGLYMGDGGNGVRIYENAEHRVNGFSFVCLNDEGEAILQKLKKEGFLIKARIEYPRQVEEAWVKANTGAGYWHAEFNVTALSKSKLYRIQLFLRPTADLDPRFRDNLVKEPDPPPAQKAAVVTPSGLRYEVLRPASGARPGPGSTVVVNYKGMLMNGKTFDEQKNVELPVSGLVKGFAEALQLMPVGSKYRVFIPAALHYGSEGAPGIPPNADVHYEIELLSIKNN